MKLYFARHGQTDNNQQRCIGKFNDPLNDLGRTQSLDLSARILSLGIGAVVSSNHLRAKETAQIIAQKIGKSVFETSLLGEKKWPEKFEGKSLSGPEVKNFFDLAQRNNSSDPYWHYGGEENFFDVKQRARLFLDYVSGLDQENILAVSHEYFIKMAMAVMMSGHALAYDVFRNFFHFVSLDNAALVLCQKDQEAWKLVFYG